MRLFIATSFPDEVIADLNGRVTQFRGRLPAAGWVKPASQHVTFAFLGEQPESAVENLGNAMEHAAGRSPAFRAKLRGCGFFPNPRHARVGWIGLDPESGFLNTARAVREEITGAGVKFDAAEFKPHLTLMRIRDPWPPASVDLFHKSLDAYQSAEFEVDRVILYSSKLDPSGAIHTPIRSARLG